MYFVTPSYEHHKRPSFCCCHSILGVFFRFATFALCAKFLQSRVENNTMEYFSKLKNSKLRVPELYLYGGEDQVPSNKYELNAFLPFLEKQTKSVFCMKLCKAEEIEGIVSHRRKLNVYGHNGLKIVVKKWERGQHVAHFHKNGEEYVDSVHAFLRKHVFN